MSREEIYKKKNYFYIINGTWRQIVSQDHPEAVRRDWEATDGKKGTKYEREVTALFGKILEIAFIEGDYGTNINITLDPNEDGISPILSLSASGREGEDFMKKLPNINLDKEVKLRPFNFDGENGNEVRGLEILQQDEADNFTVKITNFFRDNEKKLNLNGIPTPPKENDEMTKADWKIYFLQVNQFLIEYTRNYMIPKIENPEKARLERYDEGKANLADIPF